MLCFQSCGLSVCLSVSRFTPLILWTLKPLLPFWLVRFKSDLIQPTTDKTSLLQTETHDLSFDKSLLLLCGDIHGHYVPLVWICVNLTLDRNWRKMVRKESWSCIYHLSSFVETITSKDSQATVGDQGFGFFDFRTCNTTSKHVTCPKHSRWNHKA